MAEAVHVLSGQTMYRGFQDNLKKKYSGDTLNCIEYTVYIFLDAEENIQFNVDFFPLILFLLFQICLT